MYAILNNTSPFLPQSEYDSSIRAEAEYFHNQGVGEHDRCTMAYVEGRLYFPEETPAGDRARASLVEFDALPESLRRTGPGRALLQEIQDVLWFERAELAMAAAVGGACKMSKSGAVVIFADPQCGRHDLSGRPEFAREQLHRAGIDVA